MELQSDPFDAALADTDLLALYESVWDSFLRLRSTVPGTMSAPHFVRIPDGYADLPVRLAVVGQQTRGWRWEPSAAEQQRSYPCEGLLHDQRRSPFWQATRHVADAVGRRPGAPVLWANLIAADVNREQPVPDTRDAIRRAVPAPGGPGGAHLGDGLLGHIFDHAQPHAAVLFVGPTGYYGHELRQQFPGIEAEPVGLYAPDVIERLHHDRLPAATFRTSHPRTLKTSGQWEIVRSLPSLILDSLSRD